MASPQTPLGELTALPPDHLAVFRGPASKGRREERIGERREGFVSCPRKKKEKSAAMVFGAYLSGEYLT